MAFLLWTALSASQARTQQPARETLLKPSDTTQRILDCLDLSELPKELRTTAGMESALFLKEVLDRIELPAAKTYRAWLNRNGVTASRSIQPPVLR